MTKNPKMATQWKGRILIHYSIVDTKEPEVRMEEADEAIIEMSKEYIKPMEMEMIAEIGQGICLPETEKYKIRIAVQDFSCTTKGDPRNVKDHYCWFNYRFDA